MIDGNSYSPFDLIIGDLYYVNEYNLEGFEYYSNLNLQENALHFWNNEKHRKYKFSDHIMIMLIDCVELELSTHSVYAYITLYKNELCIVFQDKESDEDGVKIKSECSLFK